MAAKGSSGQSVETLAVARPARTSTTKTATKKTTPATKTAPATSTAPAATKTAAAAKKTAPAKKTTPAKKAAPAAKKAAPAKKTAPAAKKTAPTKTAPTKTAPTKTGSAPKEDPAKKAPAKKAPAKEAPAKEAPAKKAPAKKAAAKGDASRLAVREGERPWTARETAEVRDALQSDEQRLEEEISAVEEEIGHLLREGGEGAGHDQADVGSNTFERDHEMSMAKNAKDNLVLVREAIARIDDGTYGVCESCGNPIGKMRLQAFPRATLCMECKQRQERR